MSELTDPGGLIATAQEPSLDKVRPGVLAEVRKSTPAEWVYKAGIATVGTLTHTTLFIEYGRITPLAGFGIGHVNCFFELTIVPALTDIPKAEDSVDAAVVDLLLALDGHEWLAWSGSEKKVIAETYLGWVVTVSAIASTSKTIEKVS